MGEFYRRSKTGYLDRWCKTCSKADVARRKSEARAAQRAARLALPPPTEKHCTGCDRILPVSEFYTTPSGQLRSRCDGCRKTYVREWAAAKRTGDSDSAQQYRDASRSRARRKRLARYGLTPEQYDARYDSQGGTCLICGTPRERIGYGSHGGGDVLCVDHHHDSGAVRGLLCSACNRGIGLLGDSPERLASAIAYLAQGDPNGWTTTDKGAAEA